MASIGPLFTGETTCAFTDLEEVYNEYEAWSFEYYRYSQGRLIAASFWNAYDLIKQASEDAQCVNAATFSCSLIEPGSFDLSDLKVRFVIFENCVDPVFLRLAVDSLAPCCRMCSPRWMIVVYRDWPQPRSTSSLNAQTSLATDHCFQISPLCYHFHASTWPVFMLRGNTR